MTVRGPSDETPHRSPGVLARRAGGGESRFADAPAPAFVSVSADEADVAEALHALELVLRDTDSAGPFD